MYKYGEHQFGDVAIASSVIELISAFVAAIRQFSKPVGPSAILTRQQQYALVDSRDLSDYSM